MDSRVDSIIEEIINEVNKRKLVVIDTKKINDQAKAILN